MSGRVPAVYGRTRRAPHAVPREIIPLSWKRLTALWRRIRVEETHWVWCGTGGKSPRVQWRINGKQTYVRIRPLMFALYVDRVTNEDILLCDEPVCVNPHHLKAIPGKAKKP
jgi:hypothetical protein